MIKRIVITVCLVVLALCVCEDILHVWGVLYMRSMYRNDFLNRSIDGAGKKVLCLGESSTIGIWVGSKESYPAQLERMLRAQYRSDAIQVIVPPHIGQNTSQIADRLPEYITNYEPDVIVMMVGCNNHWSLAESHITKFIPPHSLSALRLHVFVFLNDFHLFKFVRFVYLSFAYKGKANIEGLRFAPYIAGAPQRMHHVPPSWVLDHALRNEDAYRALWRYDVSLMIRTAQKAHIPVIMMTYPMSISVPVEEFVSIAEREKVLLVRNDRDFDALSRTEEGLTDYIFAADLWHPTGKGYTIVARNVLDAVVANGLL